MTNSSGKANPSVGKCFLLLLCLNFLRRLQRGNWIQKRMHWKCRVFNFHKASSVWLHTARRGGSQQSVVGGRSPFPRRADNDTGRKSLSWQNAPHRKIKAGVGFFFFFFFFGFTRNRLTRPFTGDVSWLLGLVKKTKGRRTKSLPSPSRLWCSVSALLCGDSLIAPDWSENLGAAMPRHVLSPRRRQPLCMRVPHPRHPPPRAPPPDTEALCSPDPACSLLEELLLGARFLFSNMKMCEA